jgi:hypothetical protein
MIPSTSLLAIKENTYLKNEVSTETWALQDTNSLAFSTTTHCITRNKKNDREKGAIAHKQLITHTQKK